jgi:hypothetical protein
MSVSNGRLNWQSEGKWSGPEWAQQQKALMDYYTKHPEEMKRLVAEIEKNGGSIEVKHPTITGKVSDDETPDALTPPTVHTDKHQYLAGEGNVEGRLVKIGENSGDVKIPPGAKDNTPVTVKTADGAETVIGHIVTQNGAKYFCPDEGIDAQGNRHKIAHTPDNLVPLRTEGAATYE